MSEWRWSLKFVFVFPSGVHFNESALFTCFFFLSNVILHQSEAILSVECRDEEFLSFQPMQKRLDIFFSSKPEYDPELFAFCQKLLILSHGQATVDRGCSDHEELETGNMQEDTMVAWRLVCDYVTQHGGVTKVPLKRALELTGPDPISDLRQRGRRKSPLCRAKREKDYLEELKKRKNTSFQQWGQICREDWGQCWQSEGSANNEVKCSEEV